MPVDVAVVLMGPMAVGKSAVGRMLAQRTGSRFVDTDRVVAERHGSIPSIFEREGEEGFRSLEAAVVADSLAPGSVVSLGGGAVLHEGTRDLLASAVAVFLDTDLATVLPRIAGDSGRPLLAARPAERWQELYDARLPVYTELADLVIDCRGLSVRATTEAVLRAFAGADIRITTRPGADHRSAGAHTAPPVHPDLEIGTHHHGD